MSTLLQREATALWTVVEKTVPPTYFPVSIDDAKQYCDYDDNDRDGQFDTWIKAATETVEADCDRALLTQTFVGYLPYFSDTILIPKPPVTSITSITYYDTAGAQQTLATSVYQSNLKAIPPRITLDYNQYWPDTRCGKENAVAVTFVAGYGDRSDIPAQAREAILGLVKQMFDGCTDDPMGNPHYRGLIGRLRWRLV